LELLGIVEALTVPTPILLIRIPTSISALISIQDPFMHVSSLNIFRIFQYIDPIFSRTGSTWMAAFRMNESAMNESAMI